MPVLASGQIGRFTVAVTRRWGFEVKFGLVFTWCRIGPVLVCWTNRAGTGAFRGEILRDKGTDR